MRKLLLITFLVLIVAPLVTFAQQTEPIINSRLVGRVIDGATKEPLPGAVVRIEGTTHAVVTDIEGKFSFVTGQKFPYKLIITFTGYEKQEFIADGSPVEIGLKDAQTQLNQVVVVGYGSQKRKDITGSVASVPALALKQPVPSLDRALQGSVSGIQVTQATGQPGAGVTRCRCVV
jgi:hypothetical protein